ncbi:DoxX family protein [Pedobacter africanus]|uniref:Uncharacterized membrane protein n=1 Tax=Pedobacter africanus TaxID=151894 RepID=A0A1W2CNG9_9SPHI|nr:hypothetical protein [Pedobacter africanus]SMC86763.1 Uncharacterized membrane protein [Pedobacter africanus]
MNVLVVLFISTGIAALVIKIMSHEHHLPAAARIGMSVMLLFTALGHFMFARGMSMMVPDFIPFKIELVYLTGVIEVAAAIGLQLPKLRLLTAWLLILFFILILPSNAKAALEHIDMYKANYEGTGTGYLWFRIPLQLFFIAWIYFSAIKSQQRKSG